MKRTLPTMASHSVYEIEMCYRFLFFVFGLRVCFALSRQLNSTVVFCFQNWNSIALYAKSCLARWFSDLSPCCQKKPNFVTVVGPIDWFLWTGLHFIFCRKIWLPSSYSHFYSYTPKTPFILSLKYFQISSSLKKKILGMDIHTGRFVFGKDLI